MAQTLIKNGTILTMDPDLGDLTGADLLVDDDRIAEIGQGLDAPGAAIVDASRMIVVPGFVNAHLHTWQTGIRGTAGDWSIPQYLHFMHANLAPKFTANDTYLGNVVGALNQINNGATTIFDWCHNNATPGHSDGAIDGLLESGIRAVFGHGSPKPDAAEGEVPFTHIPQPDTEIKRLRTGRLASDDARVTLAMAILGPDFSTYEVCEHDFRLAREHGLLSSAHVWGTPARMNPDGYEKLAKAGLLGPDHNMVHGCYLGDDEIKLLVDNGVSITVTAETEIQMSGGLPVTGRVRALGARPSIGVDVESSVSGDMFAAMRITLQYQRSLDNQAAHRAGEPAKTLSISPREALEWATIEGARTLRLDDRIGSLTPGKQADIIMLDTDGINMFPVHDPVQAVVFHANGGNVDTVIVAGDVLKQNGRLVYPRLAEMKEQLAVSGQRIMQDAGLSPASA